MPGLTAPDPTTGQPSLFTDVNVEAPIVGMVHTGDPHTSTDAAVVVARRRTELHARVLRAFGAVGPMTDEELERLPEFAAMGPSTLRKRRSELFQQGALVIVGERLNTRGRKMAVWDRSQP